ncbi:hypothetical protein HWV62_41286 [Athelia sp. TMB]|nr:hypothetical protein HWV62_14262 [Athelia sp. TMB]KAF7985982.1 hypothetical protein HWV62_41286 [Athelia sp. TMB]
MSDEEVIVISSGDSSDEETISHDARRNILVPVVQRVVDALGGFEGDPPVYRLGDYAQACLSDLKKLWRKDDTDDDRTCAHIFWASRVLPNDLVPILLVTAGKGLVEDKRAIAAADLCCAMTWPIDLADELKELDEEDRGVDFTQLTLSHLVYKQALLKPGVMQALFAIVLPPLAKPPKERTPRDGQVVNVILHIIRNLAFIRDMRRDIRSSADQAELGAMQGKLIRQLEEAHFMELLLAIAANEDGDPLFNSWNTLVLEIFYLLFRGAKPSSLTQPTENLHRLLQAEEKGRRDIARKGPSRHSRFGTTISVKLNPNKKKAAPDPAGEDGEPPAPAPTASRASSAALVLHRQSALTQSSGSILDYSKQSKSRKHARIDELSTSSREEDSLGVEARAVLKRLAVNIVIGCFNPFLSALLKDIKSERPKITEKDNLRLLFVTKWFLEFFLRYRVRLKTGAESAEVQWGFGLIAEVIERGWIVWVLKRMREAVEDKPKQWTELQAGIECLAQLLLLIDAMAAASGTDDAGDDIDDAAQTLRHQLIYNGEVLDIALDSIRAYKEGTQSLTYLESSVYLAWSLLRMLERWGRGGGEEMYVRKKKMRKRKSKKGPSATEEGEGVPDVEDVEEVAEDEDVVLETMFTFETFEAKFANAEITRTLLAYLARYKEYESSENMKRIVNLIHRQAVKAKAEGLYFNVSTLNLFKMILDDQKSFPRDQPHKDLINLINFILRKFFKALEEEPFLAVEAFFPKNRNQWKQFSSWEPEEKVKGDRGVEDARYPPDVQVKKGHPWSAQVGIAIAALMETGAGGLIGWVKDILGLVSAQRQRLIDDVDKKPNDDDDDLVDLTQAEDTAPRHGPSNEAIAKITDYMIPYITDEQADAATKNPHLKLMFRLVSFFILDEDADELEWYVPAAILPADLTRSLNVINQFLDTPFDLEGKKAKELLSKKTRRRRRARRSPSQSDSDADPDALEPRERKKKEKKKKEKEIYKSAQFIEDSDEEYGNMDAFFEKERQLRERMTAKAAEGGGPMRSTGTKKRRKGSDGKKGRRKKRKAEGTEPGDQAADSDADDVLSGSDKPDPEHVVEPIPRPRPRPVKPRSRATSETPDNANAETDASVEEIAAPVPTPPTASAPKAKRKSRVVVISDDDD